MSANSQTWTAVGAMIALLLSVNGCRTGKSREATPLPTLSAGPAPVEARQYVPPGLRLEAPLAPEPMSWVAIDGWSRGLGLGPIAMVVSNSANTCLIGHTERILTLTPGSRRALCNGTAYWLGYPPQIVDGILRVHALDAEKNLLPLLDGSGWAPPRGGTIIVDPGHGGRDPGTRSVAKSTWEKDYTLDWALRLRPLLQAQGWKVVLTREADADLSLPDRVRIANECGADLFISLHFNSGEPNRTLEGIETYCLTPSGMPSTLQRFEEENPARAWPNNGFDVQNLQIAQHVHGSLVEATRAEDRGVRRARFMAVLREQQRPAILIEGGYLSNPSEANRIDTSEFRQSLAAGIARALRPRR